MPNNITTADSTIKEYITNNNAAGLAEYFSRLPDGSRLKVDSIRAEEYLDQLQIILQALEKNTTVTELDLSCNHIGIAGAEFLARRLGTNAALINLNLSWNNIGPTWSCCYSWHISSKYHYY